MNTQNEAQTFAAERGTFSFSDFVQKKATTPVVRTRIYMDNEAAHERADLEDYIGSLRAELESLNTSTAEDNARYLTLGEKGAESEKAEALKKKIADAKDAFDHATDAVLDSCAIFVFRWKSWDEPRKVIEKAHKQWLEQNGHLEDTKDVDRALRALLQSQQAELAQYVSCALVAAGTAWVENIHGDRDEKRLTVDQVVRLVDEVILPTEKNKLFEGVSKAVGAGDDWFMGLDAGFPGRGTDLA